MFFSCGMPESPLRALPMKPVESPNMGLGEEILHGLK